MRRFVLLALTAILVGGLSTCAGAYILQAVTGNDAGEYGMGPVTLNSSYSQVVETNMLPNPGYLSEVYSTGLDGTKRLVQFFLPYEPASWGLVVTAGPNYAFDSIRLRMWSPQTTGADPDAVVTLQANGTPFWQGKLFSAVTAASEPAVSYTFDFDTWGDLRTDPLNITFVPEPASLAALFSGLAGFAAFASHRRR